MRYNTHRKLRIGVFLLLLFLFVNTLSAYTYSKQKNTIHFQAKHEKFAKIILDNLEDDIDLFQRKVGSYPDLSLEIYLTENDEEYRKYCGNEQAILEFSQACYSPRRKAIILRSIKDIKSISKLRQIILHEYIHHFVHSQIKNPPLWFNEGMAVYYSGGLTYGRELNFIKNYVMGNSLSLSQMRERYPENRIKWESFYAESALAVKYLSSQKKENFYKFWEEIAKTADFSSAFVQSFYFTEREFSTLFENYAKKHFRMELLLASSSILWAVFPFIFLAGALRRKIHDNKILRSWQKMENNNRIEKNERI